MQWNDIKDESKDIPLNVNLLITDGEEVYPGFYDSMSDWRMYDMELCMYLDFDVTHWMNFPEPPNES